MKFKTLLFIALFLVFITAVQAVTIPYGKSGEIIYNLKTGSYEVYQNKMRILYDGYSSVNNKGKIISSTEYARHIYSKVGIKDAFGTGFKHVILSQSSGLPDLKQVFYTYTGRDYFLSELVLEGKALSSNQMNPIQGIINAGDVKNATNPVTLFVPFDNDTFIRYNAKVLDSNTVNVSAEVSAVYSDLTRIGIVTGSVEHENWKTGVKTSAYKDNHVNLNVWVGYTDKNLTRDDLPHGTMRGDAITSPKIFFGYFQDWRSGMELYAKTNRLAEPPIVFKWTAATPVGWNSWGVMQDKISYDKVEKVVDFFAEELKGFRSGESAFIDLDSYWDKLISGGLEGDFSKLKEFADYAKTKGLKPGVYWAPFTDWGFKSGSSRRAEGGQYTYGEMWTKVGKGYHDLDGARALDPTHPGTQARIKLVIDKFKSCGFEMIKIDFLGHAAVESDHFYDPKIRTGMQAYKAGMEYLLKQLDGKMLIYAAISPSMASGRYIQIRRIACDAFKSINDTEYTLNGITNGWWQTYLYDYLDADHVVLSTEDEGANIARMLSAVVAGTFISGDDFSADGPWKDKAKQLFQNPQVLKVIKDGKAFRPVDGNERDHASSLFVKQDGDVTYLAIFNYGNTTKNIPLNLPRLGLSGISKYKIENLTQHLGIQSNYTTVFTVPAANAVLLKITKS